MFNCAYGSEVVHLCSSADCILQSLSFSRLSRLRIIIDQPRPMLMIPFPFFASLMNHAIQSKNAFIHSFGETPRNFIFISMFCTNAKSKSNKCRRISNAVVYVQYNTLSRLSIILYRRNRRHVSDEGGGRELDYLD